MTDFTACAESLSHRLNVLRQQVTVHEAIIAVNRRESLRTTSNDESDRLGKEIQARRIAMRDANIEIGKLSEEFERLKIKAGEEVEV